MGIISQSAFILLIVPVVFSQHNEYCELHSCPYETHTMCIYPPGKYGNNCWIPSSAGLGVNDIEKILYSHNIYRRRNEKRGNSRPSQSSETSSAVLRSPLLFWDAELALIAQRWANQCLLGIDICRNVKRFNVTQRVAVREAFIHEPEPIMFNCISEWHEEENLQLQTLQSIRIRESSNRALNPYSRIPWGNANRIGCGVVRTSDVAFRRLYFVCNYGYWIQN